MTKLNKDGQSVVEALDTITKALGQVADILNGIQPSVDLVWDKVYSNCDGNALWDLGLPELLERVQECKDELEDEKASIEEEPEEYNFV